MKQNILFIFAHVLFYISRVFSQGGDWSDEDTIAVKEKLLEIFTNRNSVIREYEKLHPDHPDYLEKTKPNAPKMLRLGFHDCLPHHKNIQGEVLINGINYVMLDTAKCVRFVEKTGRMGELRAA